MTQDKYKTTHATISFSALETMQKMVQALQDERDMLLKAHKDIAAETYDTWTNGYRAQQLSLSAIALCQDRKKVME